MCVIFFFAPSPALYIFQPNMSAPTVTSPTSSNFTNSSTTLSPGIPAGSATAFHSELRKDLTNSVLRERSEVVDKLLRHMGRSAVSGNSAVYEAVATAAMLACSKDLAVIQKVSDDASKHKDEKAMYAPLVSLLLTIVSIALLTPQP